MKHAIETVTFKMKLIQWECIQLSYSLSINIDERNHSNCAYPKKQYMHHRAQQCMLDISLHQLKIKFEP